MHKKNNKMRILLALFVLLMACGPSQKQQDRYFAAQMYSDFMMNSGRYDDIELPVYQDTTIVIKRTDTTYKYTHKKVPYYKDTTKWTWGPDTLIYLDEDIDTVLYKYEIRQITRQRQRSTWDPITNMFIKSNSYYISKWIEKNQ
jgi:hypothetical protein